jgi:glycosyltransferase involved in cell wall biosynthesis
VPKSFVYVGKIDEISRDPMYVVEKLKEMSDYSLHFYSSQKASTIERIKEEASRVGVANRIVFHQRVPYDELAKEISKYSFGLVPHKRSPITDYTVPNKIYDYKSSGIVTVMSDCPSLVYENREYGFGVIYSKEQDDFCDKIAAAENYKLDFSVKMPTWKDEFSEVIHAIKNLSED